MDVHRFFFICTGVLMADLQASFFNNFTFQLIFELDVQRFSYVRAYLMVDLKTIFFNNFAFQMIIFSWCWQKYTSQGSTVYLAFYNLISISCGKLAFWQQPQWWVNLLVRSSQEFRGSLINFRFYALCGVGSVPGTWRPRVGGRPPPGHRCPHCWRSRLRQCGGQCADAGRAAGGPGAVAGDAGCGDGDCCVF